MKIVIDSEEVEVVSAREFLACRGCVGEVDFNICSQLPVGCSKDVIIWIRKENELH